MNKKLISLLVVVIFMSIGFAAIVISLNIEGETKIAFDEADFHIFFSKVADGDSLIDNYSEYRDQFTYTSDGTNMVTYYVLNRSMNYNAIISVSCNKEVVINQEDEALMAGTVESGTITSSYVGDIVCTLNALPTPREQQNKTDAKQVRLYPTYGTLDTNEFYVVNDYAYGILPTPHDDEWTFVGWFTAEDEEVTADTIVNTEEDSIVLFAKWNFVKEFSYTGTIQSFKSSFSALYKVEIWGAQGGNTTSIQGTDYTGGYGGYTVGNIYLSDDEIIYIAVGGSGDESSFNGGGEGGTTYAGSANGGGATHVSKTETLLKDTAKSDLYIVAGGGGGSYGYPTIATSDYSGNGGNAGGYSGRPGNNSGACYWLGSGGNQASGGLVSYCSGINSSYDGGIKAENTGTFGLGGSGGGNSGAGGGGGYYGGSFSHYAGGGGGSGYIGGATVDEQHGITNHMTCYNCSQSTDSTMRTTSNICVNSKPVSDCSKIGNGFVRITVLQTYK